MFQWMQNGLFMYLGTCTMQIRLDTMVTVVDSASFLADYSTRAPMGLRPDLGEGGGLRPVVDLLVEQLECVYLLLLQEN